LVDNVCYNGPRAHVNINDGFYGQNWIEGNIIFNAVREVSGAAARWAGMVRRSFFAHAGEALPCIARPAITAPSTR
jgi:hypothetical protein